jgi:glucosamine--fructose-6-phosphate aminotransferase (isomerizing)
MTINKMLDEIYEIPDSAIRFWDQSEPYILPLKVPYLGMGSSYFAPLAFKYMNVDICPELASEYYNYMEGKNMQPNGVIISQSGRSSEALWCAGLFDKFVAITNDPDSELCQCNGVEKSVLMLAGHEDYSSSKTYINTLLTLFKGFGFDVRDSLGLLRNKMGEYEEKGEKMAGEVFDLITKKKIHGIYITGSGPNIATAFESSLILSESTKMCFTGLPMAQYDHGPKETAAGSIVIQIIAKGNSYERARKLNEVITKAGAYVITVEEPQTVENFSIIHNMIPFNFMAYYLAQKLDIRETFVVGGKVTEVC